MRVSPGHASLWASLALLVLCAVRAASAYDIGCLYPEEMPDPFEARKLLIEYVSAKAIIERRETPIVVRGAAAVATCDMLCLAVHDNLVLDVVLTGERPAISVPIPAYHNSFSRMLCMSQCYGLVYDTNGPDILKPFWDKWGLGIQGLRLDVAGALAAAANGDPRPITALLNDGWNSGGKLTYDIDSGEPVPCTANCEPYSDITGYYPKNNPNSKREPSDSKYIVEGKDKHWQPLSEGDERGFFCSQRHVVPHIGFTGKPYLFDSVDDLGTAPDPKYDYRAEALEVVERLKDTASDPIKKQKIAMYDDKLLVRGLIEEEVRNQFPTPYSFEDELMFIYGIGAGEFDAILQSWREKVNHDLVRPTTVIKRWGGDKLVTFSGDKALDEPQEIAARDFQAFQRVMPHSEYPSASACICKAYGEFTDGFTQYYYGDTLKDLKWGASDFNVGCDPDQDPLPFVSRGCNDDFVVPNMTTLDAECGESRLWGGLHFTKAVTASQELCAGFGDMALEYEKKIRNGSDFGSKFYQDDARPTCDSEPARNLRKEGGK